MKSIAMTVGFIFFINTLLLFAQDSALFQDLNQKMSLLESKMSKASKTQAQIIQNQNTLKQELDSLRIWIRRHRS